MRYGFGDRWAATKKVNGSIKCENGVFGDPYYGRSKLCECMPNAPTMIFANGATGAWDASGNVMIKDSLKGKKKDHKINVGVLGKVKVGVLDDNSLTCDSMGNCMLKDSLPQMILANGATGAWDSTGNVMIKDNLFNKNKNVNGRAKWIHKHKHQ